MPPAYQNSATHVCIRNIYRTTRKKRNLRQHTIFQLAAAKANPSWIQTPFLEAMYTGLKTGNEAYIRCFVESCCTWSSVWHAVSRLRIHPAGFDVDTDMSLKSLERLARSWRIHSGDFRPRVDAGPRIHAGIFSGSSSAVKLWDKKAEASHLHVRQHFNQIFVVHISFPPFSVLYQLFYWLHSSFRLISMSEGRGGGLLNGGSFLNDRHHPILTPYKAAVGISLDFWTGTFDVLDLRWRAENRATRSCGDRLEETGSCALHNTGVHVHWDCEGGSPITHTQVESGAVRRGARWKRIWREWKHATRLRKMFI